MTPLRTAAQQALEALELVTDLTNHDDEIYDAIDALKAALATGDNLSPTEPVHFAQLIAETEADPKGAQALADGRRWVKEQFYASAEPCPCGDRPADQCPGEWEPGCDLGNNPKYAKRVELTPKELAASPKRGEKWKVAEPATLDEAMALPRARAEAYERGWNAARAGDNLSPTEPVAWIQPDHLQKARQAPFLSRVEPTQRFPDFVPLYLAPPQRKPLTEEEIDKAYREIWRDLPSDFDHTSAGWIEQGIRYAERAHGIMP